MSEGNLGHEEDENRALCFFLLVVFFSATLSTGPDNYHVPLTQQWLVLP